MIPNSIVLRMAGITAIVVGSAAASGIRGGKSSFEEALLGTEVVSRSLAPTTPTVPFMAEAMDFVAAQDSASQIIGNCGRDGVDGRKTGENPTCDAECYIHYTEAGEWVEYEFQASTEVQADITARMASFNKKKVEFLLDGNPIGGHLETMGGGTTLFADIVVKDVPVTAGSHKLRILFTDGRVNLCSVDVSVLRLPFTTEALGYTRYHDTTDTHFGNCGSGPVDAQITEDEAKPTCSSPCYVKNTDKGEFLEYTFIAENDSIVHVLANIASFSERRRIRMLMDGRYISDYLHGPGQGYRTFDNVRSLAKGTYVKGGALHRVRIEFPDGGINLCSVSVELFRTIVPARDSTTTRIEAEHYYDSYDTTPENLGRRCDRGDGVDMEYTKDTKGGVCNIAYTEPDEWLDYMLVVKQGQTYTVNARLASFAKNKFVHLEVDGSTYDQVEAPGLGDTQSFEDRTLAQDLYLSPGVHTLTIWFDTGRVNLNYIEVIGAIRKPFDVAAFLIRDLNTCFDGDRCTPGPDNCVGLLNDTYDISEGFTSASFKSVKPGDASDKSVCLKMVMDDAKFNSIKAEMEAFITSVYDDSLREIELNLHVIEMKNLDMELTRTWDSWGYWVAPWNIQFAAVEKLRELNISPDFSFVVPPVRDPVKKLQSKVDYGGLAYGADAGIAGGGYTWISETFAFGGYFGHEWLHQVDFAYEHVAKINDIYPRVEDLPACGQGDWDTHKWFPSSDWCEKDPDFVSCGKKWCEDDEIWGTHILQYHFDPGEAFVANYCKNGVRDFDEYDVDKGGRCLDGGGNPALGPEGPAPQTLPLP